MSDVGEHFYNFLRNMSVCAWMGDFYPHSRFFFHSLYHLAFIKGSTRNRLGNHLNFFCIIKNLIELKGNHVVACEETWAYFVAYEEILFQWSNLLSAQFSHGFFWHNRRQRKGFASARSVLSCESTPRYKTEPKNYRIIFFREAPSSSALM